MRLFLLFAFYLMHSLCPAQKTGFNLVLGGGPGFMSNQKMGKPLDNTVFLGGNFVLTNKNRALQFNPGLNLQMNNYYTRVDEYSVVNIGQHVLNLNLDMLMRLGKKIFLRVGLFGNKIYYSDIIVTRKDYSGKYSYGNDEVNKDYSVGDLQAGVTIGLSFPFKLFKRENKFNIKMSHIATPLVASDYHLGKAVVGQDVEVLSRNARSTMFTLGFDFSLKRLKKKKEEEE